MLARYRIVRGARAPDDPLPDGVRQDTRKHTRHVLRPSSELVLLVLQDSSVQVFERFKRGYLELLEQRFVKERERFDELAALATHTDVYLGCNCPTGRQRDLQRCHTVLALDFMRVHYPGLLVHFPER
jgi:uncharacterized protein YeaO (DUF488 family)